MATVRRVRRIIRKIDPWTVLKVSSVIALVATLAVVVGAVMSWAVINAAGIPQKIVDLMVKITLLEEGENPFANTEQMFRALVFSSAVLGVLGTGLATLGAILYNLVSDVVGGIEVVVLEESLISPAPAVTPSGSSAAWATLAPAAAPVANGDQSPAEVPTEETVPVS